MVVLKILIGAEEPPSLEGGECIMRGHELKRLFQNCLLTCLPRSAMDSVSGMDFGQASTQFCALPQSEIPPFCISTLSLSLRRFFPVGCMLNKRAWFIAAAPRKSLLLEYWGQASTQHPQVIHSESL